MSDDDQTPKKTDIEVSAADTPQASKRKGGRGGKPTGKDGQKRRSKPDFNSVVHPRSSGSKSSKRATADTTHSTSSGPSKPAPKKHVSWASAVSLALVSTLIASTIGWVGPALFKDTRTTDALQAMNKSLETRLATETAARKALEKSTTSTAKSLQSQTHQSQTLLAASDQAIGERLDGLDVLTGTIGGNIEGLQKSLSVHSAVLFPVATKDKKNSKNKTSETSPETAPARSAANLLKRIADLEAQTIALQIQLDDLHRASSETTISPKGQKADPVNLTEDTSASTALNLAASETIPVAQAKQTAIAELRDSFPRAALIQAVRAQDHQASKKPSWLQSLLSKHIKVRDDETPQLTNINGAQAALGSGDVKLCLDHIAKLNPPVRAAVSNWIKQAKKVQKTYFDPTNSSPIGQ